MDGSSTPTPTWEFIGKPLSPEEYAEISKLGSNYERARAMRIRQNKAMAAELELGVGFTELLNGIKVNATKAKKRKKNALKATKKATSKR